MSTPPIIEDPVLRQRYRFARTTDADGAELIDMELWVNPGGGVTPHLHPVMEERFQLLSGPAEILSGRTWLRPAPGEWAVIPPGSRHAFRNRGDETAHLRCEVRPPATLQAFLEDVAALSRAGNVMRPGLPKNFAGVLQASVLMKHYRHDTVLLVPPPIVQKLLLDPLEPIARRRGYRPGRLTPAAA